MAVIITLSLLPSKMTSASSMKTTAGSVPFRGAEDLLDLVLKVPLARDHGAIDQKELTLQSMRQRPADRGLAGAGRSGQQDAALGLQSQLGAQRVVLEGQRDLGFQLADDAVDTLRSVQETRCTSCNSTLPVM